MDLIERSSGMTQRHPWELSRFQFFSDILADSDRLDSPCQILDIGAGDAWFSHQLQGRLKPGSQIVCWDSGYADHPDFSKSSPHVDGIQYVSHAPTGQFDLVLLLDVLEHVADDRAFLSMIRADHLTESADLLISVPAWPSLFSEHDVKLHHHRRYTPSQARHLLKATGFTIIRQGGLFHSLMIQRALQVLTAKVRVHENNFKDLGEWQHGPWISAAVLNCLRMDNWLSKQSSHWGVALPGLSWWALCRKV